MDSVAFLLKSGNNNNCCTAENKDLKNQSFYLFHLPEMKAEFANRRYLRKTSSFGEDEKEERGNGTFWELE